VVRTPSKLEALLKSNNVPSSQIEQHLTILPGNVKDTTAISSALFHPSFPGGVCSFIISGLGGKPVFKPNPFRPTLDDPTICQDATRNVLDCLKAGLKPGMKKPVFVGIGTTGLSDHGRDIPLPMVPLYHWFLPVPHKDKKAVENMLDEDVRKGSESVLDSFVALRCSLFTDGAEKGVEKVKVSRETKDKLEDRERGYTISRKDVGGWIFTKLVECWEGDGKEKYGARFVSITY
jgi:hypothetical protein